MTAMKPIENRRVRGVASERYPLNNVCAHPECDSAADDPHHIFPRSSIGNDSWFVEIEEEDDEGEISVSVTPHTIGLCRRHHEDVERHDAWVKLEDGSFAWYDRTDWRDHGPVPGEEIWKVLGPLDPQPARGEKQKRKTRTTKPKEGSKPKTTWAMRVPKSVRENGEDGVETVNALVEQARDRLAGEMGWSDSVSPYFVFVAVFHDWLTSQ